MTSPLPNNVTVRSVVTGPIQENTLLVRAASGEGFVIDPGAEADRLAGEIRGMDLKPVAIVLTHAHFDHVGAVQDLRELLGVPVLLHEAALEQLRGASASAGRFGLMLRQPADPDGFLTQDQQLRAGDLTLTVRELFGHAPGHVVLVGPGFVIAGDTLFLGSIGRTDLPGGSHPQLIDGIRRELLSLPPQTIVYPGHGDTTTVEREQRTNPFL